MKAFSIFALLAVLGGCSSEQGITIEGSDPVSGSVERTDQADDAVGEVQQKAQFTNQTVLNLVDPLTATLTLTADIAPVSVQVFYINNKTTNSGNTGTGPVLIQTISLASNQTKTHNVNLFHPAFTNGYGSIFLSRVGGTGTEVFQTYVQYGGSIYSVGGSVFSGGSYRLPYLSGTQRMVLAITNQDSFTFSVRVANVESGQSRTVSIPPLSTYKFDSDAENWTFNGTGSVQITTNSGGVIAMSGYVDRLFIRSRITPVKAAPFP
jgi:hypothetical protein